MAKRLILSPTRTRLQRASRTAYTAGVTADGYRVRSGQRLVRVEPGLGRFRMGNTYTVLEVCAGYARVHLEGSRGGVLTLYQLGRYKTLGGVSE